MSPEREALNARCLQEITEVVKCLPGRRQGKICWWRDEMELGRLEVKKPLDTRTGKTDFSWQQWEEEGRFQLTAVRRGKRKTRMVETELTVKVARFSLNSTSARHKPCDLSHLNLWSSLLNRNTNAYTVGDGKGKNHHIQRGAQK